MGTSENFLGIPNALNCISDLSHRMVRPTARCNPHHMSKHVGRGLRSAMVMLAVVRGVYHCHLIVDIVTHVSLRRFAQCMVDKKNLQRRPIYGKMFPDEELP